MIYWNSPESHGSHLLETVRQIDQYNGFMLWKLVSKLCSVNLEDSIWCVCVCVFVCTGIH